MRVSAEEARVLGSLIEKGLTTPQQYPLTLVALTAACNQASNRDPVVHYDEQVVLHALEDLKEQRLVRFVLPSHGRSVVRYRQVLDEALGLDARQCALLAVLMLRGPQTVGELRLRTDRMVEFSGLDDVERELASLASLPESLASSLGRRPGQKEERWVCDLAAPTAGIPHHEPRMEPDGEEDAGTGPAPDEHEPDLSPAEERAALRADLDTLRAEVHDLRRELVALRESLGG